MGIILSVYSKSAFKEFVLPALNDSDYSLPLEKNFFQIPKDILLPMEVLNNEWSIKKDSSYQILCENERYEGKTLKNHDIINMLIDQEEALTFIVKEQESVFHSYEKYDISDVKSLSIGKNSQNGIVYDHLNTVSQFHTVLEKRGDGFYLINKSRNGTYVNSTKIQTEYKLKFGDYINIMGLHMIFMDHILAIDICYKEYLQMNDISLKKISYDIFSQKVSNQKEKKSTREIIFHRAPRDFTPLTQESVEIEEPPEGKKEGKRSMLMALGPSITMVLPMLLGSVLMMKASSSGGATSLSMYSGLVMAVSSAVIGVMWSLINMNNQKKEDAKNEVEMFEAYKQYLIEKTEEVKNLYDETSDNLKNLYPSTTDCLKYDETEPKLWNRNIHHEDILRHRIGIGNIPFQVQVAIPKKKFRVRKYELAEKPAFIKESFSQLQGVPITIDFQKYSQIGLVGGESKLGAYHAMQIIAAQIAANNCYTDIKMGFIYNGNLNVEKSAFQFAKWLPHVWSEDKKVRMVASNRAESSEVFYHMTNVFRTRSEEKAESKKEKRIPHPYYILFVADDKALSGELFAKYILDKNNNYGITTFFLTEDREQLPNTCELIIENNEKYQRMYEVSASQNKTDIQFDVFKEEELLRFSTHLSNIKVYETENGGEIPNGITFFEMLGVNRLEELNVEELWLKNRIYENIQGVIGWKAGGVPCVLDVHEKYHGPHGLIAGTTGSGKSETLQTYMMSLAVNYSPDDIGFFIIDYKGGGMANLFEGLPHMIGQISNLSGNQVKRAMISIKSENRRRQRIFTENGVNNINAYTKLYKNKEVSMPIPHLFIIIDEFAELKREEEDFMKELISVAQVGRSLGVHLILATQKPSGTVDANIWSNSKFRLCLRVQDKEDSLDMLHKTDAAYITQAGRCYLQVGNDELYELFQSGYSGAIYEENLENISGDIAQMITLSGSVQLSGNMTKNLKKKKTEIVWIEHLIEVLKDACVSSGITIEKALEEKINLQELIQHMYDQMEARGYEYALSAYNTNCFVNFIHVYQQAVAWEEGELSERILVIARDVNVKLPQKKEKTQLDAVKEYLAYVAEEKGYQKPQQLWLPVLPDKIYLQEFEDHNSMSYKDGHWAEQRGSWKLEFILGKLDDPATQSQLPLTLDLNENGNVAIVGSIVSGKSTMIQTMIYSMIHRYSPEYINIYGIDFSSKMMSAFEDAPHVGGIMYDTDFEKIAKFITMMKGILEERKKLFRGGNYSQYVSMNGVVLPAIVIFIDNYAALKEKTSEQYEDFFVQLSKEGVNHGIYLVISGAGFSMLEITQRVADNMNTIMCLAFPEKTNYIDYLHTMAFNIMPENGIKGRGLFVYESRVLEYQTCLAIEAENDFSRMAIIKESCEDMKKHWKGKCAAKIPEIPEKPIWSLFEELDDFKKMSQDSSYLPFAYDMDTAQVYGIPLFENYCYMICGAARTGRTNAMKALIKSALCKESEVCIFDSPDGALKSFTSYEGIHYATDDAGIFQFFSDISPTFKERNILKRSMIEDDKEEIEIFTRMSEEIPYFIFISDINWFIKLIYNSEYQMSGFLETIIAKGTLHNIYFIADVNINNINDAIGYRSFELFKEYQKGIQLGGKVCDNRFLPYDSLPYPDQIKAEKVGVGMLPDTEESSTPKKVVIPLVKK